MARLRGEPQKPPAFQLYVKAWLSSTLGMPRDVKGAYIDLLCWSWDNGPLPNSPAWRARVLGTDLKETARIWAALRPKFVRLPQGWINARLEAQRAEITAYQTKAKSAAEARWHGSDSNQASIEHASSTCSNDAQTMPENTSQASPEHMLNGCTPSPSPSVDRTNRPRKRPVNRPLFKTYAAIAKRAFAEAPTSDLSTVSDYAKDLCANQNHDYDAEILGRALRAVEHTRRRTGTERAQRRNQDAEPEPDLEARPFGDPETRVFLACPKCQHAWEAARILPGAWWGKGITPESIARICYCPSCYAAPPMSVAAAPEEDPPCLAK